MPLIFNNKIDLFNTHVAVWENTESNDFFVNKLNLDNDELEMVSSYVEHRQKEWLCSRYLVKMMLNNHNCEITKDDYGKPSVLNNHCHISISHSKNRAAAIISDTSVGIDIQRHESKINRIHKKFISVQEIDHLDKDHLESSYHIFWGAKESMYKAWGKKELEFKRHMHVFPFKYFRKDLELKGWVKKNEEHQIFDIFTDLIDDYFLVYAIRTN